MRVLFTALLLAAPLAALQPLPGQAAGTAQLTAAASPELRLLAALPDPLSGLRRHGPVTDFAANPAAPPGLGVAQRYVPVSGERLVATLYLYDRGRRQSPEGAASPALALELNQTAAEMRAMVQMGRYRAVTPAASSAVPDRDGTPGLRCATFEAVQEDGSTTGEAVCLTVLGGRFVKTRVSSWLPGGAPVALRAASGLLSAVIETLPANRAHIP
ncbi:hypothetical protein [Pseudoroseomonas cervicalis]|uniref:hypothetical protein n=1 Tax=Teichococcus cervicalis TaxID=204525 RepID=UPI0022F16CD8|nr:hypothetical protein [Pseudoroseomonas cervicalis]WBV42124.1 hypothetical protein PFY06_12880 [Pseudoroseomonas cervicalis]